MKWIEMKRLFFLILCISASVSVSRAENDTRDQEISNYMRLIGHEILLDGNDIISRVLPIQKLGHRYQVRFSADILFNPGKVVATVDSIMVLTDLANSYFLEIEECETNEIVYSYQIENSGGFDVIPCSSRKYEKGCYNLYITILDYRGVYESYNHKEIEKNEEEKVSGQANKSIIFLPFLALAGAGFYFWKKRDLPAKESHIISIGKFHFDHRNLKLTLEQKKVELTGKEADLLFLLHSSVNETIERDIILNKVWGDEGDYVGRTLDVFVSKLRKKLEADEQVKIVNIRGVGYRLVVDNL